MKSASAVHTALAHGRASWLDWLMVKVEALPIPAWLSYLLAAALAVLATYELTEAIGWRMAPGYVLLLGVQIVYPLALAHYATTVAREALRRFGPLVPTPDERDRLERDLVTSPARGTLLATAIGGALGSLAIISSGPREYERLGGDASTAGYVAVLLVATGCAFGGTLYRAYRQLAAIVRANRAAENVDPLRPWPAHAFARLTAVLSLGIMAVTFAWTAVDVEQQLANPSSVISGILTITFGVALFVAPLWGMHQRLQTERVRRLDEVTQRLQHIMREVHTRAAALDTRDADSLSKIALTLLAERDLLARTSTWPWERGTLQAFASALGAPIALFLLTRVLGRFL